MPQRTERLGKASNLDIALSLTVAIVLGKAEPCLCPGRSVPVEIQK